MNILGFSIGAVDLISYGGAAAVCGFLIWRDAARRKGLREAGAAAGLAPVAQDVEDLPEDLTRFLWEAKAVHSSFFGG